jgi:hypothetical protein
LNWLTQYLLPNDPEPAPKWPKTCFQNLGTDITETVKSVPNPSVAL